MVYCSWQVYGRVPSSKQLVPVIARIQDMVKNTGATLLDAQVVRVLLVNGGGLETTVGVGYNIIRNAAWLPCVRGFGKL